MGNSRSLEKTHSKILVQNVVLLIFIALIGVFTFTNIRMSRHYIIMDGLIVPHSHSALTSCLRSHSISIYGIPDASVALPGLSVRMRNIWAGLLVWKYMITYFGVKSLLDVGCGRGISTAWFYLHVVETFCVEGSLAAKPSHPMPRKSGMTLHEGLGGQREL